MLEITQPAPGRQQSLPSDKVNQRVDKHLPFDINHAD